MICKKFIRFFLLIILKKSQNYNKSDGGSLFEDVKYLQYFTVKLDSKMKCFSIRKGINGLKNSSS